MSKELERALLQWVNTFQLDRTASGWSDFDDGRLFWQILSELDPEYFHGPLPESSEACKDNWIPRWKNVKHIHNMVLTYMNINNMLPYLSRHTVPDLKAVASEGSPEHTIQILKSIVYVALFSEKSNERQVRLFSTVGLTTFSAPIKQMIDEMREHEDQLAAAPEGLSEIDVSQVSVGTPSRSLSNERGADASRDKDDELLDMEARWYETVSANKDLEARVQKLDEELSHAHRQIRNMEEQLTESELSFHRKFEEYRERERLQHLNEGEMSDKDVIAQLETELAESKARIESQERQLAKLNADAVSKQELRDKLQLLTFERDELQQKAKANENLKKKIQTLQEFERKYQGIADSLEDSKSQLEQFEEMKQKHEDLKRAYQESLRTIQNCEQQIMVEAERNKLLQHEKNHADQELEQTKEFCQRALDMKEELEAKLRDLEGAAPGGPSRLEDELAMEDSEFIDTPRTATIPEGSGADVLILQQKLDLAEARAKRIEEQYLSTYEEKLGLQTALKDIKEGNPLALNHPSVKLQDRLSSAEEELKGTKQQQFAASAENAALRDKLAKASSDGSEPLDAASMEDFNTLRANHEKLIRDHSALEQHSREMMNQLDDQRSLLRRAMLRRVHGEDEFAGTEDEMLNHVREQVALPAHAPPEEKDELIKEVAFGLTAELRKVKDYDALKQELEQVRKEAAEKASEALQQELESQKRENELMISAWYSISSRLQSNVVALARKAEAPKSWMRRQQFGMGGGVTMARR